MIISEIPGPGQKPRVPAPSEDIQPLIQLSLTVPPLRGNVTTAVVTRSARDDRYDGLDLLERMQRGIIDAPMKSVSEGDALVELSTGDVIRAPFTGVLRWATWVGSTVRVGEGVATLQRYPLRNFTLAMPLQSSPLKDAVVLGTDLDTRTPVHVTTGQLCSGSYILGFQGVGKSSLLEQIACQLLDRSESVIVLRVSLPSSVRDARGVRDDPYYPSYPAGGTRGTRGTTRTGVRVIS